jgi:hypothetical protein
MKSMMMTMLLVGLATSFGVAAQDGAPTGSGATLEGTWRVQITLRNCATWAPLGQPFPALATFDFAGTVLTSDGSMSPAARGSGHGIWRRVAGRTFAATTEAFLFTDGVRSGTQLLEQQITLGADGRSFEARVGAMVSNNAGQVVFSGCASSVGQRMQ